MSIETQLIASKNYIDTCYNTVGTLGGTVPQNKSLENLSTAINTIDSQAIPQGFCIPRYSITTYAGGTTTAASPVRTYSSNIFENIVEVKDYALQSAFEDKNFFTSVIFTNLETVGEKSAFAQTFKNNTILVNVSFPSLRVLYGYFNYPCFNETFSGCTALTSVSFPALETLAIGSHIYGGTIFSGTFQNCTGLTSMSFPSLTSVQSGAFSLGTFSGCTNLIAIHFKASIQSQVENMSYYSSKWGATNATIYFDLP